MRTSLTIELEGTGTDALLALLDAGFTLHAARIGSSPVNLPLLLDQYEAAADAGPEPEPEPTNPLATVNFASDVAAELAASAGLDVASFQDVPQSSEHGYTKADVEAILAAKGS